jgi:hypothetical protein
MKRLPRARSSTSDCRDIFPAAGYAYIVVHDSYIGSHVRQYGNISFSRIFDAGHTVPFYQPETAFRVFTRIIQGDDISMGYNVNLSTYRTEGIPDSMVHKNKIPQIPASVCWTRDLSTCTGYHNEIQMTLKLLPRCRM